MALVGNHGSGATINITMGMFTVGCDQKQDPVRKMRGSIAGVACTSKVGIETSSAAAAGRP
jgi:hypothetical protein